MNYVIASGYFLDRKGHRGRESLTLLTFASSVSFAVKNCPRNDIAYTAPVTDSIFSTTRTGSTRRPNTIIICVLCVPCGEECPMSDIAYTTPVTDPIFSTTRTGSTRRPNTINLCVLCVLCGEKLSEERHRLHSSCYRLHPKGDLRDTEGLASAVQIKTLRLREGKGTRPEPPKHTHLMPTLIYRTISV